MMCHSGLSVGFIRKERRDSDAVIALCLFRQLMIDLTNEVSVSLIERSEMIMLQGCVEVEG